MKSIKGVSSEYKKIIETLKGLGFEEFQGYPWKLYHPDLPNDENLVIDVSAAHPDRLVYIMFKIFKKYGKNELRKDISNLLTVNTDPPWMKGD